MSHYTSVVCPRGSTSSVVRGRGEREGEEESGRGKRGKGRGKRGDRRGESE